MPTLQFHVNGHHCSLDFKTCEAPEVIKLVKQLTSEPKKPVKKTTKKPVDSKKPADPKKPASEVAAKKPAKKPKPKKQRSKRCLKCQQPGHLIRECSLAVACSVCADEHYSDKCPVLADKLKGENITARRRCAVCLQSGHSAPSRYCKGPSQDHPRSPDPSQDQPDPSQDQHRTSRSDIGHSEGQAVLPDPSQDLPCSSRSTQEEEMDDIPPSSPVKNLSFESNSSGASPMAKRPNLDLETPPQVPMTPRYQQPCCAENCTSTNVMRLIDLVMGWEQLDDTGITPCFVNYLTELGSQPHSVQLTTRDELKDYMSREAAEREERGELTDDPTDNEEDLQEAHQEAQLTASVHPAEQEDELYSTYKIDESLNGKFWAESQEAQPTASEPPKKDKKKKKKAKKTGKSQ